MKLDDKLRWEIKEIDVFIKKTPSKIYGIKNHAIWISISREIKEQNKDRKIGREERENNQIT